MKLQVIQLEPYDDVTSVRDRLAFVKTERVLLVLPRATSIMQRKLDLVLIQREAARHGTRLALVTHDLGVIDHAAELNISTFPSVKASQRGHWKQPLSKVFVDRSDRPKNENDAYDLMLAASRLKVLTPRQRQLQGLVRVVTGIILLGVLLTVLYLLLPSANVTLSPAQAQIDTTVTLVADPSITTVNVETARIPAALLVIDVSTHATIPTTGSADVPNTLASGTVVFTNQTANTVFIPAGTVVSTFGLTPARFRTASDATLDGGVGQTVPVTVEALQESAGPAGNVDSNLIITVEGDLSNSVSVRNTAPTRGGTIRQQGVVTREDYDNLLVLAREKIRQTSLGQFGSQLTGTQFIAPDSIKIVGQEQTTYSAFVGDSSDSLTLDMRAKVQALVIDEQLARQATIASLARKIPSGQQVSPQSITFKRGAIQSTDPKGNVTFVMSAQGNIAVVIDPDQVRQEIAGASVVDATNVLQRDLLLDPRRPPQIDVWPRLLNRLPALPLRINVVVQQ